MKIFSRKILLVLVVLLAIIVVSAWCWIVVYDNYHCVIDGELYRSGQVVNGELQTYINVDTLKTVISLRDDTNSSWWISETAICKRLDVAHIDFPLAGSQPVSIDDMEQLVQIMQTAEKPILIHCKHGADRTSLAIALYLYEFQTNEVPKSAFSSKYGHLPFFFKSVRCFDDSFDNYKINK